MVQDRTRKIVITGVLSAISIFLGITRLGFIPWFSGVSLTIMHLPVIIGAVLEGPVVGFAIGLIFGIFSLIQAAIAPTGPTDVWFTNPLISVYRANLMVGLPRPETLANSCIVYCRHHWESRQYRPCFIDDWRPGIATMDCYPANNIEQWAA